MTDTPDDTPERAHARRTDPATSHEAADSLSSDHLRASQDAVLRFLRRQGAMTDNELVERYDGVQQSPSGLRTRRKELETKGLVFDTGNLAFTPSGRRATVWASR